MMRSVGGVAFCWTLVIGAAWSSGAIAQSSATRTSSFAYDSASGLLTQEVIEPNTSSLKLETDTVYDAFGNKTSVSASGVDIATRTSSTTYDAQGRFAVSASNALGQSETWQYDARFGTPTSHTGPNGLTTTWSYDTFGRKIKEVRADGTQTTWAYLFCSGVNGGTATCPAGAAYLIQATPLASDGATQSGPLAIVYFDSLNREIGRDTQGFDGSTIRASTQYDGIGRVQKKSRPYFASGGTPQWTVYTYDALARAVTETFADSSTMQHAFHGLVTSDTNALNQTRTVTKNSQGEVVSVTDALGKTTSYGYDPFGNLVLTIDPVGNAVTATFDTRGRKIASRDPDLGAWTYAYDTASELISQTDAKGQTTTLSYDKLGRVLQRVEPDMTSAWVYDTAANGIGKLASEGITAGQGSGFQRTFGYDGLGRPDQTQIMLGGYTFTMQTSYTANGQLQNVMYPSGFTVRYSYTALGYLSQVASLATNISTAQTYWTANARDAELHLTQQTAGNGVQTTQGFDAPTGRLLDIVAGTNLSVQNLGFSYDAIGNVKVRADGNSNLTESFTYDGLNRLTSATISSGAAPVKNFSYDPTGNLLSKSDVGTYNYPAPGLARPHAVVSIAGGTVSTTFAYDANGNQTSGLGRTITYASFNKPTSITQGTKTLSFTHDPEHQRVMQVSPEGTVYYVRDPVTGILAEFLLSSPTVGTWTHYVFAGGQMVGALYWHNDQTTNTRYFHHDHLGSVVTITNETGAVAERLSYDAWGKRRFPSGADDPAGSITSQTTRGFTEQEELPDVGLVHLNGRVYDPMIGRMMSADPVVPDPMNGQAWNRYSYVVNNPLAFTDPNGYCFLNLCGFFKGIGNLFRGAMLGNLIRIGATAACALIPGCPVPIVAVLTSAVVAGVTTGKLTAALEAGFTTAFTIGAFEAVAQFTGFFDGALNGGHSQVFGSQAHWVNIAGHALVGCVSAIMAGAKCGPGALAGAVTSFAGPFINGGDFSIQGLVANTVIGGLASVAGGGKFANGAITGAFGYLFNAAAAASKIVNLGGGYTGRVDPFNYQGQSLYEIHVYNPAGDEVGIYGPDGWINKHGTGGTDPALPQEVDNNLRGITVDELRRRGLLPDKGKADIKDIATEDLVKTFARGLVRFPLIIIVPDMCAINPATCPNRT